MSPVISEVSVWKEKASKEVLQMSDCVAVVRDRKRVTNCSGSVDDQGLIHAMAGEL